MRHALLLAQRFDKRDGRLLRVRAALRDAGLTVESLAFDSGGEAARDAETRDLRPRALATLMLFAQLVIAAVITGYFLRFLPEAMTAIFWALVIGAGLFASPWAKTLRQAVIHRLAEALSVLDTSKHRYDVIWAVDPETLRLARRIADRHGARLIYDAHEFHRAEVPGDTARHDWVVREEGGAADRIDTLVTVNDPIAALYAEALPGTTPVVVRNAVNPQFFDRLASPLRAAAAAGPEDHILLYHGAIRSLRHLDALTAASHLLPDRWRLVLMGDGPLKPSLDPGRAVFLDPVPYAELPRWIAGADLGAVLYEGEGLNQRYCSPNKLYEYIAWSVPLLTTDLPELQRYAETLGCGVTVSEPVTPAAIADAVSRLSDDRLAALRARCADTAATLSWDGEADRIRSLVAATD